MFKMMFKPFDREEPNMKKAEPAVEKKIEEVHTKTIKIEIPKEKVYELLNDYLRVHHGETFGDKEIYVRWYNCQTYRFDGFSLSKTIKL